MVGDRAAVAERGVESAADPGLGGRRRRRPPEDAEVGSGADRAQERSGPRSGAAQRALLGHGERVAEGLAEVAVDLELADDVGLCRAELAGVPDHPAQGVLGAELDVRGVLGSGRRAVPGREPDRQVSADEGPQRLGQARCDATR